MSQFKGMPESRNGGFGPSWKLQTYSIYIDNLSKIHVGLGTPPPPPCQHSLGPQVNK